MAESREFGQLIASLNEKERQTVEAFIQYIRSTAVSRTPHTFESALESFVEEHEELLRRLAQ